MDGHPFDKDFDWPTLATHAGEVGRFIWYLDTSECEIDETLQNMSGLVDLAGRFSVNEFLDNIHFEDQSLIWLSVNEALVTGNPYQAEFRFVRPNGKMIWLAGIGKLIDLPGGGRALLGVNYDISEKRVQMARFELVAGEMEHRVKNLLTMVASVYRSTARAAGSVEDLTSAFMPRLTALASANALAARSGHKEIDVEALVEVSLQPVTGRNVTWQIEPCYVNATISQTIALVLNELMTNATKYGGLNDRDGSVELEISLVDDVFRLVWRENLSYELSAPVNPTGFGMEVLKNMTAATFQGRPQLTWGKDGLQFSCDWPADKVLADT